MDHRKLGRELDIFDSDPMIGAGLPFWLPGGAAARHEVESYLYELERRAGYRHVYSPALGKRQMFQLSGHWQHFADDMFPPMRLGGSSPGGSSPGGPYGDELVLRPSMCPHHALIFKSRQHSYRELPLRLAELGPMYRAERSGVLGGLSRVRQMQLNDAHIFCSLSQVGDEVSGVLRLMSEAHAALGLRPSAFRLSLRGEGGKFAGDDAMWERAERLLRDALDGYEYQDAPGEAAFYGPKIDVQVVDAMGREWTLATIQVDFHQPAQFDLSFVSADSGRERPVMVHRSLAGSMERLFGHLIEVHGGAFPVWFAPVQVAVLPIGCSDAASLFASSLIHAGLRAELHEDGSVGARVRDAASRKIPYIAVIGEKEAAAGAVALRLRDGRQLPPMPAASAVELVAAVAAGKSASDLVPAGV